MLKYNFKNIKKNINIKNINSEYYSITVFGPYGFSKIYLRTNVRCVVYENCLILYSVNNSKISKKLLKTYGTLVYNLIWNVNYGFSKVLEIKGVGYRLISTGKILEFKLGYSHSIYYTLPKGVICKPLGEQNDLLVFFSCNSLDVNKVISDLLNFKKFDNYKGKGFIYYKDSIQLKERKTKT